jgi:peroxin-5
MYAGYGAQQYQPPPLQQHQPQMQHDVAASSHDMDAAFEKAMSDWKAMGDAHKEQEQARAQPSSVADHVDVSAAAARQETAALTDDGIEDRGTSKGQLDQVWDSLKSDAARQDKLAEWENGFSQVC